MHLVGVLADIRSIRVSAFSSSTMRKARTTSRGRERQAPSRNRAQEGAEHHDQRAEVHRMAHQSVEARRHHGLVGLDPDGRRRVAVLQDHQVPTPSPPRPDVADDDDHTGTEDQPNRWSSALTRNVATTSAMITVMMTSVRGGFPPSARHSSDAQARRVGTASTMLGPAWPPRTPRGTPTPASSRTCPPARRAPAAKNAKPKTADASVLNDLHDSFRFQTASRRR